ncbi:MAG TPA: hypothetical protein VK668_03240 [Mucilaginibacter sp.]|nr:hypothetical protein [Mucilaginibacter sp.]
MKSQAINQLINFSWTIVSFIPVIYFWIGRDTTWLYAFVLVSLVFALMPARFISMFQLSGNKRFYERLGVRFIQRFVQNGTYINKSIRKNDSGYKLIKDRAQAQQYLNTIQMYERYHLMCFIFFGLTLIYAVIERQYIVALIILLANVIYNVCPVLLQQYNRLRVIGILR